MILTQGNFTNSENFFFFLSHFLIFRILILKWKTKNSMMLFPRHFMTPVLGNYVIFLRKIADFHHTNFEKLCLFLCLVWGLSGSWLRQIHRRSRVLGSKDPPIAKTGTKNRDPVLESTHRWSNLHILPPPVAELHGAILGHHPQAYLSKFCLPRSHFLAPSPFAIP